MAIHIVDAEADRFIREFAKRRGLGVTEALKVAVREASAAEAISGEEALRRLEPTLKKIRDLQTLRPSEADQKRFMDEGWDRPAK